MGSRGLMDRALDLKPEVTYISLLIIPCIIYYVTNKETLNLDLTQGCGFESRLRQEVHDCSPAAAQSAAHCSKCVHLDGLNAENTFHFPLYSV